MSLPAKPSVTRPVWATDASALKTEPANSKLISGWETEVIGGRTVGERPVMNWENWIKYSTYTWIKWSEDAIDYLDANALTVSDDQTVTGRFTFTNNTLFPSTTYQLGTKNVWNVGKLEDNNSFFISQQSDSTGIFYIYTNPVTPSTTRFEISNGKISAPNSDYVNGDSVLNASAMDSRYVTVSGVGTQNITGLKEFTNPLNAPSVNFVNGVRNIWSVGKLEDNNSFFISQQSDNTGMFYVYTNPTSPEVTRFEISNGKISAPNSDYVNGDSILNATAMDSRYVTVSGVGTQSITGLKEFTNPVTKPYSIYVLGTKNVWNVGKLENNNSFFISQVGSSAGAFYIYTNPTDSINTRFEILGGKISAPNSDYVNGDSVLNASSMDLRYANISHTQAFSTITSTPTTLSGYGIIDAVDLTSSQVISGQKEFTSTTNMIQTNYVRGANNVWSVGKLENSNSFFISQQVDSNGIFYVYTVPSDPFSTRFQISGGQITAPASNSTASGDNILNITANDSRYIKTPTGTASILTTIYSGTTGASDGDTTSIAHGLDSSKIISIEVLVITAAGDVFEPESTEANKAYRAWFNATNLAIKVGGTDVRSRPIKILVTHQA